MHYTMANSIFHTAGALAGLTILGSSLMAGPAIAQPFPITAQQRATAADVASRGVAMSDLQPDAPPSYTVKPGDTLWGIAGLYLQTPWRWPELWGMNLADIHNPHLIYPGQTLWLNTANGRALLQTRQSSGHAGDPDAGADLPSVRWSPRTRSEVLAADALPTLKNQLIEAFLAEPMVVDESSLNAAPRIVAAQDSRVLLTRGDRAYARSPSGLELRDDDQRVQAAFRIFRNATALKDPQTGVVLGYEAQYIGKALLVRSETVQAGADARQDIVPATLDITAAKEEIRVGDRLLPEPPRLLQSYVPHAPQGPVDARIVSIYGSAVANAAQNQVVVINKGRRDGIDSGAVLAILRQGARVVDKTDPGRPELKLPDERNGLLMVFSTFERLSYALVLEITSGVKVGDRLVNPL